MKIRWTRDSVRLRITPSELDAVGRGETVEETLNLGGTMLWRARLGPGAETELRGEDSGVSLILSPGDRARLAQPDAEGVYFERDGFRYFVEKDFPCAHPRAAEALEPETETFSPPPGFTERKS